MGKLKIVGLLVWRVGLLLVSRGPKSGVGSRSFGQRGHFISLFRYFVWLCIDVDGRLLYVTGIFVCDGFMNYEYTYQRITVGIASAVHWSSLLLRGRNTTSSTIRRQYLHY